MTGHRRRREGFAEKRERLGAIVDPAVVLEAALRFLEPRQRSVAEVRRRLSAAGYREDLVASAIERLGDLGILDDAAFTAAWVESRDRARPRGERALRRELAVKGVDRAVVDEAMGTRRPDPGGEGDPDVPAAERLLARHASQLGRLADLRVRRQRAYALLVRNGFDTALASELARRLVGDAGDDAGDVAVTDLEEAESDGRSVRDGRAS